MCPGINLVDLQVFSAIVIVLATYNGSKAMDGGGNTITPKEEHTTDVIRSKPKFPCPSTPESFSTSLLVGNKRKRVCYMH
jgi:hypothetical protein